MAISPIATMDAASLRQLSRAKLQKLARANQIKANLKSETIITLLLERVTRCRKAPSRKSTSLRRSPAPYPTVSKRAVRQFATATRNATPAEADQVAPDVPAVVMDVDDDRLSVSSYGFTSPESSPERTPEPAQSHDLKVTVAMMAAITASDRALVEKIVELRRLAAQLRTQAIDLRSVLRGEKGHRERMEGFLRYWQKIPREWSHEAVWSGRMRVYNALKYQDQLEITSSDEENGLLDDLDANRNIAKKPTNVLATLPPGQEAPPEYIEAQRAEEAATTHESGVLNTEGDPLNENGKRSNNQDDNEDDDRYHPVARREVHHTASGEDVPASSPTQSVINKGKGKMSAEEVEKMERESRLEMTRLRQLEIVPEESSSSIAEALLTPQEIEEDRVMALLARAWKAATAGSQPTPASDVASGSGPQPAPQALVAVAATQTDVTKDAPGTVRRSVHRASCSKRTHDTARPIRASARVKKARQT